MTSKHVGFHVLATSVYVFSTLGSADVYFHSFKLVLLSVQTTFKYTESQHGHHPLFRGETWSSRTVFPAHPNAAVPDVIRADNRSTFRQHLHHTKRNKIHSPKPKVDSQVDFRSTGSRFLRYRAEAHYFVRGSAIRLRSSFLGLPLRGLRWISFSTYSLFSLLILESSLLFFSAPSPQCRLPLLPRSS
jgi:hypothetical protein